MRSHLALAAIAAFALSVHGKNKVDVETAVKQANIVAKAVVEGDFAKVADFTHPTVLEIMGGRDGMIETTTKAMKSLKDQGFTIKSHTVGKPQEPVFDGKTAYLVIPTSVQIVAESTKIVTDSYLLGVTTDGGKTWVFVDGAGMDQPRLRDRVFPKLPEGLKLPEKKEPTVTKE